MHAVYYEKTAGVFSYFCFFSPPNALLSKIPQKTGDMLQSFWCRRYLRKMSDCFQKNVYQAAIARWLHLPHCMLPASVAKQVAEWSDHPLADFQEMVTLHLPKGHVHIEHMIIKSDGL